MYYILGQLLVMEVLNGNMAIAAAKCAIFKDWKLYQKVLDTPDANECRDIGKNVKGFEKEMWNNNCKPIAFEVVKQKADPNYDHGSLEVIVRKYASLHVCSTKLFYCYLLDCQRAVP